MVDLGNGTYLENDDPDPLIGDYVSDVVTVGGLTVKKQVIALTTHSGFPFAIFGMGFTADADGVKAGTFHRYKNFMTNLKDEGVYDVAAYSAWLDPDLGPDDNPNTFPDGRLILGGIDTGLSNDPITTLPVVDDNSIRIATDPVHFNLLLSAMQLRESRRNLVSNPEGESCVISTGANALYLINETYTLLVNSFPHAVFNKTTTLFDVPCSDRFDNKFDLSFEFIDPRPRGHAHAPKIEFTIPAADGLAM